MDVRNHSAQFDIGILEKLLETVELRGFLLNQLLSIAGQISKLTDGFGRNETPFDKTMPKELGNPLTILNIGFSTWNILDLSSIGQNDLHAPFQDVKERFPIDSSAFQSHMATSLAL